MCCVWIPDWTVSCVEILCCHSSYNGALWCVLINIHRVGRFTEDGRLIHIQNVYFHCRCVFEWAKIMEPWIQVCIGGLHFKCVCFFGLIVQRLRKDKQRENKIECIRFVQVNFDKASWIRQNVVIVLLVILYIFYMYLFYCKHLLFLT